MNEVKEIITLTNAAKNRVKEIITKAKKRYIGIRIGIDNTGCSGHSYKIDYAENIIERNLALVAYALKFSFSIPPSI